MHTHIGEFTKCSTDEVQLESEALVRNMVLIYSPYGISVYGVRGAEFEGIGG